MNFTKSNYFQNGKLLKDYEVAFQNEDSHLKDCTLLQNMYDPSERLLLKTIIVCNEKSTDDLIARISNISNPFIVNLLHVKKNIKENSIEYELYFDSFVTDLASEMKTRQLERNYFTEGELWEILNSILKGLCYLHDQEIFHGSLDTHYIKIVKNNANDSENYSFKVLHPLIVKLISEENDESLSNNEKYYLSPEEFISLKYEETRNYIDFFKSDVYCLGLCMLEAATFFSIKSCYDWETYLMNYEFILRKLLIIHNRYSKHLAYLIKNMLIVDDKTRPTIFEIEVLLANDEESEKTKRSLYLSPMRSRYNVEINSENRKNNICGDCKCSLQNKSKLMTPKLKYTPLKNNSESQKSAAGFSNFFITTQKQMNFQNKMPSISGSVYEGEWKAGRIEGKGKLFYPSGKLAYEGEWKNDCFHGKGVFHKENQENSNELDWEHDPNKINDNWLTYIGGFENDMRNGKGRLILINGTVFDGEFVEGNITGPGVITLNNGAKISGMCKDNYMIEEIKN